ncbi:hypothetical protein PVAP13_9KG278613 [Panicum virgatum]|uniref:Uncharacterized protein n=1 Tax=Panicum virgatum TaxID=38727 RepID=A0A8T0NKL6_PANVG|nr:hypothetical protein PVAP13_9KG278613 [Panicum virgatum]
MAMVAAGNEGERGREAASGAGVAVRAQQGGSGGGGARRAGGAVAKPRRRGERTWRAREQDERERGGRRAARVRFAWHRQWAAAAVRAACGVSRDGARASGWRSMDGARAAVARRGRRCVRGGRVCTHECTCAWAGRAGRACRGGERGRAEQEVAGVVRAGRRGGTRGRRAGAGACAGACGQGAEKEGRRREKGEKKKGKRKWRKRKGKRKREEREREKKRERKLKREKGK